MEVSVDQFNNLEERVAEIESSLVQMNTTLQSMSKKMDRIEVGLFGDQAMNYSGVIEKIKQLEKEIDEIKRVNDKQEISIGAKRSFTDSIVLWGQRIFWTILAGTAIIFLLTGKIGVGDILNLVR